jgi:hypothetical protein
LHADRRHGHDVWLLAGRYKAAYPKHSTTTSADLIAAASDAARRWHFNPQMKGGKPIDGYARVPVKFDLTPLPDGASRDQVEKLN